MNPVFWPVLGTGLLLSLLITFWLLWPLRGRPADTGLPARQLSARVYKERLQELNADHMSQRIDAETYAALKLELDRALLADAEGAAPAASVTPARSLRALALVLLLIVPALAAGLYLGLFRDPGVEADLALQAAIREDVDRVLAGQAPRAQAQQHNLGEFMQVMKRRVQERPDQADGWLALGLGHLQVRDMAQAKQALSRAAELKPDDEQIVFTYIQASIMSQQGAIEPPVLALLNRWLQARPGHQGAWLMLGLGSLRAGDGKLAVQAFERLQALRAANPQPDSPEEGAAALQVERLLAEARQLTSASTGAVVADAAVGYDIEVTLAPELARQLPPDATVFVFARALQGPPMPIAAWRRDAGQFPLRLRLTDADNLMPERRLSDQETVVLQAKISTTGSATPAAGDWEAAGVPVKRGQSGLVRLRISDVRR